MIFHEDQQSKKLLPLPLHTYKKIQSSYLEVRKISMKVELDDGKRQVLVKKEFLYAMSIFFASHYMLSSLQISCGSTSDQKMFTESSTAHSGQVQCPVHPCVLYILSCDD